MQIVKKYKIYLFKKSAILTAAAAIGGVKPPFIYNHLPVAYVGHKGGRLTNLLKKTDLNMREFWALTDPKLYHIQLSHD